MNPRLPERLLEWVRRVCPVERLDAGEAPYSPDRARLTHAPEATVAQRRAALDALLAFDSSDVAQAQWEFAGASLRAVGLVAYSSDPIYTADRILNRVLWTALNDVREAAGLPRTQEAEIVAMLVAAANEGAGTPASLG